MVAVVAWESAFTYCAFFMSRSRCWSFVQALAGSGGSSAKVLGSWREEPEDTHAVSGACQKGSTMHQCFECISILWISLPRGNQGLGSLDPRCCDNKLFAGSCEPGHDGRWCDLGSANILPASLRPGDLVAVRSRLKSVICCDMWICMVILCGMLESLFRGCGSNFGALQATAHALMERLLIPWLSPMKITMLSVLREIPEEIAVMEKVLEAYRSFACIREVDALPRLPTICSAPAVRNFPQEEVESSEDGEESSDYSSANESFLDEDPASENLPEVLGYWSVKRSCKRILEARMARLPIIAQPY